MKKEELDSTPTLLYYHYHPIEDLVLKLSKIFLKGWAFGDCLPASIPPGKPCLKTLNSAFRKYLCPITITGEGHDWHKGSPYSCAFTTVTDNTPVRSGSHLDTWIHSTFKQPLPNRI